MAIHLKYKQEGSFLSLPAYRGIVDRLPRLDRHLEFLTPDTIRDVIFEVMKLAINTGLNWKLWYLLYQKIPGMERSSNLVLASCRQYPRYEELLKRTGSYWTATLSTLTKRDEKYPEKKREALLEIMKLIQDDSLEMAILTLMSYASALVSCNPSFICSRKTGTISESERKSRQEEECRNLLLEILDSYLKNEYAAMLKMFFQAATSSGFTEEIQMRSLPWVELLEYFKKAYKVSRLGDTAPLAYGAFARALPGEKCDKCVLNNEPCRQKWKHCRKRGHQTGLPDAKDRNYKNAFRTINNCELCLRPALPKGQKPGPDFCFHVLNDQ